MDKLMHEFESLFFKWAENKMNDYWDDSPVADCVDAMCQDFGFDEEVSEWLTEMFETQSAIQAGIPLSVIQGKCLLTDHFSQDYIDHQIGKTKGF